MIDTVDSLFLYTGRLLLRNREPNALYNDSDWFYSAAVAAHLDHEVVRFAVPGGGARGVGVEVHLHEVVRGPLHLALAPVQHAPALVHHALVRVRVVRADPSHVRYRVGQRQRNLEAVCTTSLFVR